MAPPPPWLGVTLVQKGVLTQSPKVLVDRVDNSGPAYNQLQSGDILLQIESVKIHKLEDVDRVLDSLPAGTRLEIVVQRKQKRLCILIETDLRTKDLPVFGEKKLSSQKKQETGFKKNPPKALGIYIEEVERRIFVKGVVQQSPAARAGIRPGDEILLIQNQKVHTLEGVLQQVKNSKTITLKLRRGEWHQSVQIQPAPLKKNSILYYPKTLDQMGLRIDAKGYIQQVVPRSYAEFLGFSPGARITLWNGAPLRNNLIPWGWNQITIQKGGWKKEIRFYVPKP